MFKIPCKSELEIWITKYPFNNSGIMANTIITTICTLLFCFVNNGGIIADMASSPFWHASSTVAWINSSEQIDSNFKNGKCLEDY